MAKVCLPAPKASKKIGNRSPAVVLTGRRRDNHFMICLDGRPAALTRAAMRALIKLVLAHSEDAFGLARIAANPIYQLRHAIDGTLGRGASARLIDKGCGGEYRLLFKAKDFKSKVAVTPCFLKLVDLQLLTKEEADLLRRRCGRGSAANIEAFLNAN